jgi:hypothetical protein
MLVHVGWLVPGPASVVLTLAIRGGVPMTGGGDYANVRCEAVPGMVPLVPMKFEL